MKEVDCKECGRQFAAARFHTKYCSRICRLTWNKREGKKPKSVAFRGMGLPKGVEELKLCTVVGCGRMTKKSTTGKCKIHAFLNWKVSKSQELKTNTFYVDDIDAAYKNLL